MIGQLEPVTENKSSSTLSVKTICRTPIFMRLLQFVIVIGVTFFIISFVRTSYSEACMKDVTVDTENRKAIYEAEIESMTKKHEKELVFEQNKSKGLDAQLEGERDKSIGLETKNKGLETKNKGLEENIKGLEENIKGLEENIK